MKGKCITWRKCQDCGFEEGGPRQEAPLLCLHLEIGLTYNTVGFFWVCLFLLLFFLKILVLVLFVGCVLSGQSQSPRNLPFDLLHHSHSCYFRWGLTHFCSSVLSLLVTLSVFDTASWLSLSEHSYAPCAKKCWLFPHWPAKICASGSIVFCSWPAF